MKLRPSSFRGLVQKLAVPPLLLFAPHLVNYHLFKVCVYESWLIFSCLPLQYYFVRCCHMGLFQVFSSGLLKGQHGLLKGFSQLSRDARLVWLPAMGPSCFSLERVLFSLGTFVLCQKSISPWPQWWGWRRESPRGWNSSFGCPASDGWLWSGEAACPVSQPQGLLAIQRSREVSSRPEVGLESLQEAGTSSVESFLASQLALFCRVAPSVLTGSPEPPGGLTR